MYANILLGSSVDLCPWDTTILAARQKLNQNTLNVKTHAIQKYKLFIFERTKSSSYKEHKVNALASGAEEGRVQLRKAAGSCKQALIRGCPNGETSYVHTV